MHDGYRGSQPTLDKDQQEVSAVFSLTYQIRFSNAEPGPRQAAVYRQPLYGWKHQYDENGGV